MIWRWCWKIPSVHCSHLKRDQPGSTFSKCPVPGSNLFPAPCHFRQVTWSPRLKPSTRAWSCDGAPVFALIPVRSTICPVLKRCGPQVRTTSGVSLKIRSCISTVVLGIEKSRWTSSGQFSRQVLNTRGFREAMDEHDDMGPPFSHISHSDSGWFFFPNLVSYPRQTLVRTQWIPQIIQSSWMTFCIVLKPMVTWEYPGTSPILGNLQIWLNFNSQSWK